LCDIASYHAIAASSECHAVSATSVVIGSHAIVGAVITDLDTLMHETITATCQHAVLQTCIGFDLVSIITCLDALLSKAIPAGRQNACTQAVIGLDGVTIVTFLVTCFAFSKVCSHDAVTT
jgi:hypothetical protein